MASLADRTRLLQFASSFLWADLEIDRRERAFFLDLARELGAEHPEREAEAHLSTPPPAHAIDPMTVSLDLAAKVRTVALRAIASDGRVDDREMEMFFLLDSLLPRTESS
ncbi:MAG: hypothetical protein QM702_20740 [Rubrivivax sp.]